MPLAILKATHPKTKKPVVAVQMQEQLNMDPVALLRSLREQFPQEWDMVNRELILPPGDRLKRVNGHE